MVADVDSNKKQRWYPDYQSRDIDVINYEEFRIAGCDIKFRGPGFDPFRAEKGSFFSCLGQAHTYGCYFPRPYPTLLSSELGMPALNLGVGGAGPGVYTQYDILIDAMNRGRFVVLQCMAARAEANSRFAADGYVEFVKDRRSGESMNSGLAWTRIIDEEPSNALRYVAETRLNWIETSRRLLERLEVPVIFFWFAQREPDYAVDRSAIAAQIKARSEGKHQDYHVSGLSGEFPHFIDGWTAGAVADMCAAQASCVSSRGMNKQIISQLTGKPIGGISQEGAAENPDLTGRVDGVNRYYPSPEMHEDAAIALLPVIRRVLGEAI